MTSAYFSQHIPYSSPIDKAELLILNADGGYVGLVSIRIALVLTLLVGACSVTTQPEDVPVVSAASDVLVPPETGAPVDSRGQAIPPAPQSSTAPLTDEAAAAVEKVWQSFATYPEPEDVRAIGSTGDPRLAWLLSDIVRFFQSSEVWRAAIGAFNELVGTDVGPSLPDRPWRTMTDYMIAWDLDAPPGYSDFKRRLFALVEPGWEPFFEDSTADVDWRFVSWGGVLIDDRVLGDTGPCLRGCIPALDDPPVTAAAGGSWYPDDGIVFAVELNGESRAYPKNIMEVHEMVNDTLGGRRIGMPYCTLCGAAQAFFTDEVPAGEQDLVLRTSGLLSRSNKVMYELNSKSMFDTFLGVALTGPLREREVVLTPVTVVTTTWGEWKLAHPQTTIVAEDGGRGIEYPADPLRGRDDNGPIFPVGDVDPRLDVQELVLGVVAPDGTPIAFAATAARTVLERGDTVAAGGVHLVLDGGGLRAVTDSGAAVSTHEAFWFAWSQFHPETLLWVPEESD